MKAYRLVSQWNVLWVTRVLLFYIFLLTFFWKHSCITFKIFGNLFLTWVNLSYSENVKLNHGQLFYEKNRKPGINSFKYSVLTKTTVVVFHLLLVMLIVWYLSRKIRNRIKIHDNIEFITFCFSSNIFSIFSICSSFVLKVDFWIIMVNSIVVLSSANTVFFFVLFYLKG